MTKCKEIVFSDWSSHQCYRKAVEGTEYCKQHARVSEDTPTFMVYRPMSGIVGVSKITVVGETDKNWMAVYRSKIYKDGKKAGDSRTLLGAYEYLLERYRDNLAKATKDFDEISKLYEDEKGKTNG